MAASASRHTRHVCRSPGIVLTDQIGSTFAARNSLVPTKPSVPRQHRSLQQTRLGAHAHDCRPADDSSNADEEQRTTSVQFWDQCPACISVFGLNRHLQLPDLSSGKHLTSLGIAFCPRAQSFTPVLPQEYLVCLCSSLLVPRRAGIIQIL